ncbi:MAG: chemoreceptor glutamine deamidase CheD [Gammaproteobacteria bacterium]|nr:chemoreceptor glutamine deamidase CheD [Gammaproteobacteria bacterium]
MYSNYTPPPMPPVLKGYEHIKRYWDKTQDCYAAKILPGEYYVTMNDECVTTVLGSCVSACIRDTKLGIGGMNHFMLPVNRGSIDVTSISDAARYGNFAMEHLINDIMHNGGQRKNMEFKLFGGGKVMAIGMDVGQKNIDFVLEYMSTEGFYIAAQDLGDIYPRKVNYFPKTGKVKMKKLKRLHNDTIVKREVQYLDQLKVEPVAGEIELF